MLRSAVIVVLLAGTMGCAMRISGVVRDEGTGAAIIGASVVVGERSASTDAVGRYRIGSEWKRTTMTVGASGYEPLQITVDPGNNRYPVQDVILRRVGPAEPAPRRSSGRAAPIIAPAAAPVSPAVRDRCMNRCDDINDLGVGYVKCQIDHVAERASVQAGDDIDTIAKQIGERKGVHWQAAKTACRQLWEDCMRRCLAGGGS